MVTILDLPAEVILSVADHLDFESSCWFRLTCRGINRTTLSTFSQKNFSTRLIVFHRRSLQQLVAVAEHPVFGPAVRTLKLLTYHIVPIASSYGPSPYNLESHEDSILEYIKTEHDRRLHNQSMLTRRLDLLYLTRAMRGLSNCRKIVITDNRNPWMLNAFSLRFVRHILDVMLKAAAASNLPIEKLDFDINSLEDPMDTFELHHLEFLPLVDPDDRKIDSLTHLRVSFCSSRKRQDLTANENPNRMPYQWEQCLVQFLALFPRLWSLHLEVSTLTEHNLLFSGVSRLLHMPHLRRVKLVAMEFKLSDLTSFLSRHESTLEEIAFRKIVMGAVDDWDALMLNILNMPRLRRLDLNRAFARRERVSNEQDTLLGFILVTDKLKSAWSDAQATRELTMLTL